jgi:hypothetical protein
MSTPDQAPSTAPPNPSRKANPLLWIVAGVLGLFVILGLVVVAGGLFLAKKASDMAANPGLAAVKLMVAANPDVELVSSEESKGTATIREKKTGKVVTVNFDQIQRGQISFEQDGEKVSIGASATGDGVDIKGKDGTIRFGGEGKLPEWLPSYPGATSKTAGAEANTATEHSGMAVFTTEDAPQKVLDFYQDALKQAGITDLSNTTTTTGGKLAGMLTGSSPDNRRAAQVLFGDDDGKTSATITYSSKK